MKPVRSRLLITVLQAATAVGALPCPAQTPIERHGACPDGYRTAGSFCVPEPGASPAIPRGAGHCPAGSYASGGDCVTFRRGTGIIPRASGAACPPGWHADGAGCISFHQHE